jgi:hypothetical protein
MADIGFPNISDTPEPGTIAVMVGDRMLLYWRPRRA